MTEPPCASLLLRRGVNFKPHGKQADARTDKWIIPKHDGYLTDMFFMFDAVKNRQITTHGEYTLQAIGRLCGLTTDECLARMVTTPPRLWTSHSCYGVIRTFALGVQQWVKAMMMKKADESIADTVVRLIKTDPVGFAALHMVYALPTTDPRWSSKQLWVRQSRLTRADKTVGEGIRSAPRMPAPTGDFGIQHDPDRDKAERVERLTREVEDEGQELEDMYEGANESSLGTPAEGKMPKKGQTIWKAWIASNPYYYPAKVIALVRNESDDENESDDGRFPVKYTIQWLVDEEYNECSNGETMVCELDMDMNEWADEQPASAKDAEKDAKERHNRRGSHSKRARRSL
jgi:hypothetical protein